MYLYCTKIILGKHYLLNDKNSLFLLLCTQISGYSRDYILAIIILAQAADRAYIEKQKYN